jgi:hypothetical protein
VYGIYRGREYMENKIKEEYGFGSSYESAKRFMRKPFAAILPFSAWAEKPDSRENWRTYPPLS